MTKKRRINMGDGISEGSLGVEVIRDRDGDFYTLDLGIDDFRPHQLNEERRQVFDILAGCSLRGIFDNSRTTVTHPLVDRVLFRPRKKTHRSSHLIDSAAGEPVAALFFAVVPERSRHQDVVTSVTAQVLGENRKNTIITAYPGSLQLEGQSQTSGYNSKTPLRPISFEESLETFSDVMSRVAKHTRQ